MRNVSILFLGLMATTNASANISEKATEKVDEYHEEISDYITEKTEYFDEIVGNYDEGEYLVNNTYAILNIKQSFNSLYDNDNNIDFKFKAHLPYTEERWNFFLDTNASDFNSLEDKIKESFTDSTRFLDDSSDAIMGLIFDDIDSNWKKSYKLGVKLDFPLDPFVKFNIYNTKELTDNIDQRFNQEFFAYYHKGEGAKTNLDYILTTDNNSVYQSNSSFQYLNNDQDEFEFTQQFSRWDRLSEKGTLKSSIGMSSVWSDRKSNNNYWINTRYRHNLYDNWLYGKVIPEVSFNKEYDYEPNYGIMLELEIFFAKDEALKNITNDS